MKPRPRHLTAAAALAVTALLAPAAAHAEARYCGPPVAGNAVRAIEGSCRTAHFIAVESGGQPGTFTFFAPVRVGRSGRRNEPIRMRCRVLYGEHLRCSGGGYVVSLAPVREGYGEQY